MYYEPHLLSQKHYNAKHGLGLETDEIIEPKKPKKQGESTGVKCPKCDRLLRDEGKLKMHIMTHNHPCTQCDATFTTECALKVRCHTETYVYFVTHNHPGIQCDTQPSWYTV